MHTTPRFAGITGTAVLTLAAVTGCGLTSSTNEQNAGADGGSIEPIGYSALFLQDPAQAAMVRTFQADVKKRRLKMLSPTSANGDAAKQDSDIRSLVNAGAKSLFVIPADAQAVVPAIQYATGRGVRVFTLMLGPSGGKTTHSLEVDNKAIGDQACRYLGEKTSGRGTVLQVLGDLRQSTAQNRQKGFDACMKSRFPNVKVLTKTGGQWDPAKAAESAAGALSTNPEIRGMFLHSDGYVPSVSQVLAKRGAQVGRSDPDHVWTISVDGTPTVLDAIRAGKFDATITQPVDRFVSEGLDGLEALAGKRAIKQGPTDHGTTVVLSRDGYTVDLFPPTLIDDENVDDPANWANAAR
jgi:ABC-type sugar transport system substrate-binding protein